MKRRSAPRRRTPPKRGEYQHAARRSSAPRRRSLSEEERARRTAVREAVIRRDRTCVLNPSTANRQYLAAAEAAGYETHRCFGDRETMHHLRKASAGGPYSFENLVLTCAFLNDDIEDHPRRYETIGLVIR